MMQAPKKFYQIQTLELSNNNNELNNTKMTVNTDDVTDITIVDSLHKDILSISEQLRNIWAEHHSKYLESKQNKNTNTEKPLDTTSYAIPITQKDELLSDDNPNKQPEGTICLAGGLILNGIDESLLSQKLVVEVRQFPGAIDMYKNLKPIFKQTPEFLILHINTIDTSTHTPNEIVDKVFTIKRCHWCNNKS